MEDIILRDALEIIERNQKRRTAPNIALFGPAESGKTAFLERLVNYCRRQPSEYRMNFFRVDLKKAPTDTDDNLYKYICDRLSEEAARQNFGLELPNYQAKFDIAFDNLVGQLVSAIESTEAYLILIFDHIDTISFERATGLVSRFRFFSDNTEATQNYRRLGIFIAGIKSLFELRKTYSEAFVSYDIIKFPRQSRDVRNKLTQEQLEAAFFNKKLVAQHSSRLANLTGGEWVFLEYLLDYLRKEPTRIGDLKSAAKYIFKQNVPALRHIAIRVWSDSNLQKIIRDLLKELKVPQMDNNPDIDENQLTGAVVLSAGASGFQSRKMFYEFRNDLVKQFLAEVFRYLDEDLAATEEFSVSGKLLELKRINEKCEKAIRLSNFLENLEFIWNEITDYPIRSEEIEIKCYIANQNNSTFWRIDTKTNPIINDSESDKDDDGSKAKIKEIFDDWRLNPKEWKQKKHTFFHWAERTVAFTYTLTPFDNFLVALSVIVPKNKVGNNFTEFTLNHLVRFIKSHKDKIIELVLAEFGKDSLKNGFLTEQRQKNFQTSVIKNLPDNGGSQAILYWTHKEPRTHEEPKKFLTSRAGSVFLEFLEGESPDEAIDFFNNECRKIFDGHNTAAELKGKLRNLTQGLYSELKKSIADFDKLAELNEGESLCVESHTAGLKIPFELIPFAEKDYLSTRIVVSRRLRLDVSQQTFRSPFHYEFARLQLRGEPFRVLIVANDDDGKLKQVENEADDIRKILESAKIESVNLFNRSIEAIESILREKKFHLLHFCGEGKFVPGDEKSTGLRIKSEADEAPVISYGRFAGAVKNAGLSMVYLNCCHGGVIDRPELGQTYLNCMEALIKVGIPNVIGFRWAIDDLRARSFAENFYKELFKKNQAKDLKLAMLETRRKLWSELFCPDVVASSLLISQTS